MDGSPSSAKSDPVILVGVGFTTSRVARRLLARGVETWAAVRNPDRFTELASLGLKLNGDLPQGAILIHTVPPGAAGIRDIIEAAKPRSVVYISSTGVYGDQHHVDHTTPIAPADDKGRARVDEEQWVQTSGPWSSLIVRPAAIYGPGRGVHMRVLEGKLARGSGAGVVSRIHVDDLAAIVEAGALSDLAGAWPVADERPCSSEEITQWCANLLGIELTEAHTVPTWGRRVDGSAIREALGLRLLYPDYESGILASLSVVNGAVPRIEQSADR